MHLAAVTAPLVATAAAAASGAPVWVELVVPVITGLFLLTTYFVKDWLTERNQRNRSLSQGDTSAVQLIETLRRDVEDARAQRDALTKQLDVAVAELRALLRGEQ